MSVTQIKGNQQIFDGSVNTVKLDIDANLDFHNFQALNFRIENLTSDPSAGNPGRLVWRTDLNELHIDDGSEFVAITSGGGVTFPILAPTGTSGAPSYSFSGNPTTGLWLTSDGNDLNLDQNSGNFTNFNVQGSTVFYIAPGGLVTTNVLQVTAGLFVQGTQSVDFDSNLITNVLDPVNPQDAATKNYVDTHSGGGGGFTGTVSTTDATPTTILTIPTTSNHSIYFEVVVIGTRTGGTGGSANDTTVAVLKAKYKNVAGTVTLFGTDDKAIDDDNSNTDVTLAISGTNVLVKVTGDTNNNYDWTATTIFPTSGGGGGVTYPLLAPDGNDGAPSYSFSSNAECGFYFMPGNQAIVASSASALAVPYGQLGIGAAGNEASGFQLLAGPTTDGASMAFQANTGSVGNILILNDIGQILAGANGSNTNPAFAFNTSPHTGMFLNDPNEISFTAGGVQVMDVGTSEGGLIMEGGFGIYMGTGSIFQADDGLLTALAIQFSSAPDIGFYHKTTVDSTIAGMAFVSGGAIRSIFGANSLDFYDGFYLSFPTDFDGGIFFGPTENSEINGNDSRLEFTAGGSLALTIPSAGGIAAFASGMDVGVATDNSLWFGEDTSSGMFMTYSSVATATQIQYNNGSNIAFSIDKTTGDTSVQTHQIHDVVDPTSAQDAATKNYVDNNAGGPVATASLPGQTASVNPVVTVTAGADSVYRVSIYHVVTLADTGGAATSHATITWQDASAQSHSMNTSNISMLTLGAFTQNTFVVQVASGQNVHVSSSITSTFATPEYDIYVTVEQLI